jgi:hypothetical protein
MERGARHGLVRLMGDLTDAIVEELRDKLSFHRQLPYKVLGCFVGEHVPSRTDEARRLARECADEFDQLITVGKGPRLHRVAHRLLGKESDCRKQLELFVVSNLPLRAFPIAWVCILQYVLIPLVGRRVEAAHAQIKRIGFLARNAQPPYISASLRLGDHLALLNRNPSLYSFCCRRWRSNTLLDDLLGLLKTKDELRSMSRHDKLLASYQCSLASEFRSMAVEKAIAQRLAIGHRSRSPWKADPASDALALVCSILKK